MGDTDTKVSRIDTSDSSVSFVGIDNSMPYCCKTIRYFVHRFAHPLSAYCIRVIYACAQTRSKFKFEKADVGTMPTPYSIDLRWRVVWFDLVHGFASHEIADLFCLSERTVRRYITLFHQTGDVKPVIGRNARTRN